MLIEGTASGRAWQIRDVDDHQALQIAQRHGLPEILGRVLTARGFTSDTVGRFLEPRLRDWLPDPSHLLGMDVAAARLARAVLAGERVGMIGDYDVDGATSVALLASWLRDQAVPFEILVPDRLTDGYGASSEAFAALAQRGCRLVLCLDNGTTAFEPLVAAAALGLEVIVVDHHTAEAELPQALAVINPNRRDQVSALGHLAAVGVTFLLLMASGRELRRLGRPEPLPDLLDLLDLVALGTVCDVVRLEGANRALVHQGLKVAARGRRPGLVALAHAARIGEIEECHQLGFILGPRINAAGRLGEPLLGSRLLLADDAQEAAAVAARLEMLNATRQGIEREILDLAEQAVRPQLEAGAGLLVVAGRGWHLGVLGIVASRLVDRHGRPVFVIGLDGGTGKGSGRSVAGIDLGGIVIAARRQGILIKAGGHAMAAGLTVAEDRLEEFTRFAVAAAGPPGTGPRAPMVLDGALSVRGIDIGLATDLRRLAPFGAGNPEPRFCIRDAIVVSARVVGQNHVSCMLADASGGRARAIAFRVADGPIGRHLLAPRTRLHLAGQVRLERWEGQDRVSLRIDDVVTA